MRISPLAREGEQPVLAEERVVLDLVGRTPARARAPCSQARPGSSTRRAAGSCRASRSSAIAAERDARPARTSSGQWSSSRSRWSVQQRPQRVLGRGLQHVGLEVAGGRSSSSGRCSHAVHAALPAIPFADLGLVTVGPRGVDLAVADLQRVACGLSRREPSICQVPKPQRAGHARCPGPRSSRSSGSVRSCDVTYPRRGPLHPGRPLLPSPVPGRLAQLGERRLDKAEVTGSSPVSPTSRKPRYGGVFIILVVPMWSRFPAPGYMCDTPVAMIVC